MLKKSLLNILQNNIMKSTAKSNQKVHRDELKNNYYEANTDPS